MRAIAVELTARCNQRCAYCYNAWRDDGGAGQPEPTADELLARLAVIVELNPELEYLTLTGGEPLMRGDILQIIDGVGQLGLGVAIISNGGKLDDELADALAARDVRQVQITLAGHDAATHEAICGAQTFAKATAAIARLRRAGVRASGSILCTAANASKADAIATLFAELGVGQVAFNRFNPAGYGRAAIGTLMPSRTQVLTALALVDRVASERSLRVVCTMPIPPCAVETRQYPHIRFGSCSAGLVQGEAAMGTDGLLRLCTLQTEAVGDPTKTALDAIMGAPPAIAFRAAIPAFCEGCPSAKTCLGGCGAAAHSVLGAASELDPFIAQHVDDRFRSALQTTRSTSTAPPALPADDREHTSRASEEQTGVRP